MRARRATLWASGKKVAWGLYTNAAATLKLQEVPYWDDLPGINAGAGANIMFFPDTCEIAAFALLTGTLNQDKDEFEIKDIIERGGADRGAQASIALGLEYALYWGEGNAGAESFEGVFKTAQASLPSYTSAAAYASSDLVTGDKQWGWLGVTGGIGAGAGGGVLDWEYYMMHHWDLERELSKTKGRCLCNSLRASNPAHNMGAGDLLKLVGSLAPFIDD